MSAQPLYSVLLMQEYSLPDVARVFALHRNLLPHDASRLAKGRWGFLAESVLEEEAHALERAAATCGLAARVIPADRLVTAPAIRNATVLSLDANGFAIRMGDGKEGTILYDGVGVLAVYAWKKITETTALVAKAPSNGAKLLRAGVLITTGIPLPKKKELVEQTTQVAALEFYLDLVLKQPLVRLRIDGQTQAYGLLKERMLHGVHANFRVLTELIATRAHGRRNRGADVFLAGKPVALMGYEGPGDADLETRWLLTVLRETRA